MGAIVNGEAGMVKGGGGGKGVVSVLACGWRGIYGEAYASVGKEFGGCREAARRAATGRGGLARPEGSPSTMETAVARGNQLAPSRFQY